MLTGRDGTSPIGAGIPAAVVARQLGHSSSQVTTSVYEHLLSDGPLDLALEVFRPAAADATDIGGTDATDASWNHSYRGDRLRCVKEEDRKEFEGRLLVLVREWMARERDGRKVGHFVVIYETVGADDETQPSLVAPQGSFPGETRVGLSFSSRSDWINEAFLREALEIWQARRFEPDDDEDESEDEDD